MGEVDAGGLREEETEPGGGGATDVVPRGKAIVAKFDGWPFTTRNLSINKRNIHKMQIDEARFSSGTVTRVARHRREVHNMAFVYKL